MNMKNIHLAYFSATFSTKRIVREIASQFQKPVIEYDITSDVLKDDVSLGSDDDLLIVGVPSIFPKIAEGRPNADDIEKLHDFASKSRELLLQIPKMSAVSRLMVKGNRPYRDTKPIPLHPEGSKGKCTSCHACVKMCPVGAITMEEPYKTNEKKCISCGRCVVVCPEHARHFGGLLYKAVSWKFEKAYSEPKQPEFFYVNV